MFYLHSRSHSSPEILDDFVRATQSSRSDSAQPGAVKEEEGVDEEKQSKRLVTDDYETLRDFDFDSPLSEPRRTSVEGSTDPKQRYIFGHAIPLWMTSKPNSGRISTFIAKHAPCFWCSGHGLNLTTTNAAILSRLGALCGLLGLCQTGSACFLLIVMFNDRLLDRYALYANDDATASFGSVPALWNVNTFVFLGGLLGTLVFFIMIYARRRVFRELDLAGSLRFMWLMLWIVPLQIYCAIGMFDYHGVANVWVKHWWSAELMAWFRSKTCRINTYNTYCVVPIDGLPKFTSEKEWCMYYYNSNQCEEIRSTAQSKMSTYSKTFYNTNGAIALFTVLMLALTVNFLEGIITRPIVQKSRESNIPLWLTLPTIGCFAIGAITLFSPSSVSQRNAGTDQFWPGVLYLCAAVLYLVACLLGYFISHYNILNSRDKKTKSAAIVVFIFMVMTTLLLLATIFVQSILLSSSIVNIPVNNKLRGEIACLIAAPTCSFCNNDVGQTECPEWTETDVKIVLSSQLKSSAALAAIFMIYSVGALRFGFVLLRHISRYQIDYV
jgi:hypothetical protein